MPKVIKIAADGTQSEYAGKAASAGSDDAGEFVVAQGDGTVHPSFFPPGIGQDVATAIAGEALSAGDMVYFNGSGQAMKADADSIGKAARGYVLQSYSALATATIYFNDSNTALTGLTPGATYYLSETAGQVTTTSPTTAGHISQEIGYAISATRLRVNIQVPIVRA
jgi:hypothetical protein